MAVQTGGLCTCHAVVSVYITKRDGSSNLVYNTSTWIHVILNNADICSPNLLTKGTLVQRNERDQQQNITFYLSHYCLLGLLCLAASRYFPTDSAAIFFSSRHSAYSLTKFVGSMKGVKHSKVNPQDHHRQQCNWEEVKMPPEQGIAKVLKDSWNVWKPHLPHNLLFFCFFSLSSLFFLSAWCRRMRETKYNIYLWNLIVF